MNWKVAEAKQRLSEVLRAAHEEPQRIFKRQQLVAAVVDGETFEAFCRWREQSERPTLGQQLGELRQLCADEGWKLEVPDRQDRPNPFVEVLGDAALRHERPE